MPAFTPHNPPVQLPLYNFFMKLGCRWGVYNNGGWRRLLYYRLHVWIWCSDSMSPTWERITFSWNWDAYRMGSVKQWRLEKVVTLVPNNRFKKQQGETSLPGCMCEAGILILCRQPGKEVGVYFQTLLVQLFPQMGSVQQSRLEGYCVSFL